jgi:Uroporphyrinogen decarboxylase (URO-D)
MARRLRRCPVRAALVGLADLECDGDILVVPHALGQCVSFVEGEGPRLDALKDPAALGRLRDQLDHAALAPVYEAIARVRQDLPAAVTLVGFCGARQPREDWTITGKRRCSVPRYFFTIRGRDRIKDDHHGTNLLDVAAALSTAESKIRELRKESGYDNDPTLMVIVTDEARRTVLSLPFFPGH